MDENSASHRSDDEDDPLAQVGGIEGLRSIAATAIVEADRREQTGHNDPYDIWKGEPVLDLDDDADEAHDDPDWWQPPVDLGLARHEVDLDGTGAGVQLEGNDHQ